MKNFVIAVFAILIFLIGLLAILFEFIALIDPEKPKDFSPLTFIVIIAAASFPISLFLWKLSKRK